MKSLREIYVKSGLYSNKQILLQNELFVDLAILQEQIVSPFMRMLTTILINGINNASNNMLSARLGIAIGFIFGILIFFIALWHPFMREAQDTVKFHDKI